MIAILRQRKLFLYLLGFAIFLNFAVSGLQRNVVYADELSIAVPVMGTEEALDNSITWLEENGLNPVLIKTSNINIESFDGLMLPGGGDVDPSIYGKKRIKTDTNIHPEYDVMEISLIYKFAEAKKPILGICRGCQLINVAFGGTLEQHIPGGHYKNRDIVVGENSWLYPYIGNSGNVYHLHHQCIETLGDNLIATEWDSADGRIEAIQHTQLPIYGVQWHPEFTDGEGPYVVLLFKRICLNNKGDSF